MNTQQRLALLLASLMLFALAGCQPKPAAGPANTEPAAPGDTPTKAPSVPTEPAPAAPLPTQTAAAPAGGPGTFDLSDPAMGLAALSSYRQALALSFNGSVGGQEAHATTTARRTVITDPAAQITWLEIGGVPQMYATVGKVTYTQYGADGPCAAANASAVDTELALFELHTLPALRGAEEAGEETLNELATRHYTFDERALGQAGWAKASGEVWVAADGGYIVKYTLRVEGEADSFGPGAQGAQTWEYQLSDVNAVTAPDLPETCAAGQAAADLPLPPEAQNVTRLPGFIAFDASLTAEQVAQFYQAQVAALGWTAVESTQPQDDQYILNFRTAGNALLSVRIRPGEKATQITVQSLPSP